jgi:hypothetical protein
MSTARERTRARRLRHLAREWLPGLAALLAALLLLRAIERAPPRGAPPRGQVPAGPTRPAAPQPAPLHFRPGLLT